MLLRRINDRKLPPCKAFYAEQTTDSSIAIFKLLCQTVQTVEVWRSLVACFVRDEEAGGSNPLTSTIYLLLKLDILLKSLGYLSFIPSKNIPCIEPPTVKVSI